MVNYITRHEYLSSKLHIIHNMYIIALEIDSQTSAVCCVKAKSLCTVYVFVQFNKHETVIQLLF